MRDFDVRKLLRVTYLEQYLKDTDSLVMEEVAVHKGSSRIDIAVFNGSIHGYEIKSDLDTLERLPTQITHYSKVFDYITVICGSKHTEKVDKLLPDYYGIIEVKEKIKQLGCTVLRKPIINPERDCKAILDLLWKEELSQILELLNITKGLKNKTKAKQIEVIGPMLDADLASKYVRELIKLRGDWRVDR